MIENESFATATKEYCNRRWVLSRYVNIRNATRFNPKLDMSYFNNSKDEDLIKDSLRVEKAWNLYHKLRQYKMRSWWD